jgi:beta-barrel assembly-enhancing protease
MSSDFSNEPILATATARFSDGASARAMPVQVRLTRSSIEILEDGARLPKIWALKSVRPATALTADGDDVLLRPSRSSTEGASLFIRDRRFIQQLAATAPHLTASSQRMRVARPLIVGAVALASLVGVGFYLGWSPARWAAGAMPDSWRQTMGDGAIASMTGKRAICDNREGRAALNTLMDRVSGGKAGDYKVVVVDWQLINAFAAPGDRIMLTRGILAKASGPDEIAGVIAHELGHSLSRDPETGIVRALGLTLLVELITGGGSGTIGNVGLMLTQTGYTRSAERRADQTASRLLKDAGISPLGMSAFFRKLARMETDGTTGGDTKPDPDRPGQKPSAPKSTTEPTKSKSPLDLDIFSTHPPSEERAKYFDGLGAYPTTPALDTKQWAALQRICSK